jgi:hypothetical protein
VTVYLHHVLASRRELPVATAGRLALLIGILCSVAPIAVERPALADTLDAQDCSRLVAQAVWRLTDATVSSRGKKVAVGGGTLVSGYALQSTATSIGDGPYRRGRFQLSGTLFRPAGSSGQDATWQLNGTWAIVDLYRPVTEKEQSGYVAGGKIQAVLEFNPGEAPGIVQASLFRADVLPAGGRMVGQGTFSGNQRFEGMLSWRVLEPSDPVVRTAVRSAPAPCVVPGGRGGRPEPQTAVRLLRETISGRSGSP